MPTAAVTTTSIGSACRECGTLQKSGKASCCARGGSWFGYCGSAGNANILHAWHEGIWACKARQFKTAKDQRLYGSQGKSNASDDASMGLSSTAVTLAVHLPTPTLASVAYGAAPMTSRAITASATTIMHTPANMPTREPPILPANATVTNLDSGMIGSMHSASAASDISTSVSITARACAKLFQIMTHISMMLMIICSY